MSGIVDRLLELLATKGGSQYGGERLSQSEHALQCAFLAECEGAPGTVIAAALLHDIGHLLHAEGEQPALRGIDNKHQELGAQCLLGVFGPAVAEPVRPTSPPNGTYARPILAISAASPQPRCAASICKAGHSPRPRQSPFARPPLPTKRSGYGFGTMRPKFPGAKRRRSSTTGRRFSPL